MDAKIYHFETPDMHVGKDHLCVNVRNNSKTKFNQTKDHYKLSYKTVGIVFFFLNELKDAQILQLSVVNLRVPGTSNLSLCLTMEV